MHRTIVPHKGFHNKFTCKHLPIAPCGSLIHIQFSIEIFFNLYQSFIKSINIMSLEPNANYANSIVQKYATCQRIIHVEYAPYETSNIMTQKISQVGIPHNHMMRGKKGKKRLAQKSLNYKHHNTKIPNNLGYHNKVKDMTKFEYHVSIIKCCPSTFEHWMLCIQRLLNFSHFKTNNQTCLKQHAQ